MRKPNVCFSTPFFTNPVHVFDYFYLTGQRKPVKVSFAQTDEDSMVEGIYMKLFSFEITHNPFSRKR